MADNSRKKSIIVSIWIYFGFIVGGINTMLFAKKGLFLQTEYGLTRSLTDIAILLSSFASFGAPTYVLKFFPYYKKKLAPNQNDLLGNGLLITIVGFILVAVLSILAQPLIIQKYIERAPLLVDYFYWVLPFTFGYMAFSLLDGYAWNLGLQMATNILKEVVIRLYISLLILLYFLSAISLKTLFIAFCFQYIIAAAILLYLILKTEKTKLVFKRSVVTQKFRKQIFAILVFALSTSIVGGIKIAFDTVVLASLQGLEQAAIYTFIGFIASIISVPFRSMISVYFPLLVKAWGEKNFKEIDRIYKRSSINLLIFSLLITGIAWIGFDAAIEFLGLNEAYRSGKNILLVLALVNVIDAGTGLNAQIIQSSTMWRFEFKTNVFLAFIILPFTYYFTKAFGTIGPAYAQLLGISLYNVIRIIYLRMKYNFFPLTYKTTLVLCAAIIAFIPSIFLNASTLIGSIISLAVFCLIFLAANYWFKTSPDMIQIVETIKNRLTKHR